MQTILGLQTDLHTDLSWEEEGRKLKKSIGIAQKILLHVISVLQKFPGSI